MNSHETTWGERNSERNDSEFLIRGEKPGQLFITK